MLTKARIENMVLGGASVKFRDSFGWVSWYVLLMDSKLPSVFWCFELDCNVPLKSGIQDFVVLSASLWNHPGL